VMENSLRYLNIEPDQDAEDNTVDTYEVPQLTGEKTETILNELEDTDVRHSVVGAGDEIVASNRSEGEQILPNDRVLLITDEPEMPDITGWSLRDVVELADLLDVKLEPVGNGYVTHQHVEEGTPLKEGDYLGVEFLPPGNI